MHKPQVTAWHKDLTMKVSTEMLTLLWLFSANDTEWSSLAMTTTALDWWSYAIATLWRVLARDSEAWLLCWAGTSSVRSTVLAHPMIVLKSVLWLTHAMHAHVPCHDMARHSIIWQSLHIIYCTPRMTSCYVYVCGKYSIAVMSQSIFETLWHHQHKSLQKRLMELCIESKNQVLNTFHISHHFFSFLMGKGWLTHIGSWKSTRINVALLGASDKMWSIFATKSKWKISLIKFIWAWIGTDWSDGCNAMSLRWSKHVRFLPVYYIQGGIFSLDVTT